MNTCGARSTHGTLPCPIGPDRTKDTVGIMCIEQPQTGQRTPLGSCASNNMYKGPLFSRRMVRLLSIQNPNHLILKHILTRPSELRPVTTSQTSTDDISSLLWLQDSTQLESSNGGVKFKDHIATFGVIWACSQSYTSLIRLSTSKMMGKDLWCPKEERWVNLDPCRH